MVPVSGTACRRLAAGAAAVAGGACGSRVRDNSSPRPGRVLEAEEEVDAANEAAEADRGVRV